MSIKAIIFDMDGTLIEAKEWHFRALNEALGYFGEVITDEEHHGEFDGLPTRVKLAKLSERGRIAPHLFDLISDIKQDRTLREIARNCYPRVEHLLMMAWLKQRGFKLGVATNSIRPTAETMLKSAGLYEFLDCLVTNEDVRRSKPDPEMYHFAAGRLGLNPDDCLVVEDHDYGIQAGLAAGCSVEKVNSVEDLNLEFIARALTKRGAILAN